MGWDAVFHPVLESQETAWHGTVGAELQEDGNPLMAPRLYSGLIFTSPRAVERVHAWSALQDDSGLWATSCLPAWQTLPVFAVGPKTAAAAAAFLSCEPRGVATGSAAKLAEEVISAHQARIISGDTLPLLFLCGKERRDTIPYLLAEANVRAVIGFGHSR